VTTGQPDNTANATIGKFGYRHFHVNLFYPINFTDNIDCNALTIVHEFGHHAYNLGDEYRTPTGPQGSAECAPLSAESPTLNYCLMDVWTRGGNKVQFKNYTVNEFCVASNHDPDRDTVQESIHHESAERRAHEPGRARAGDRGRRPARSPDDARPRRESRRAARGDRAA